MPGTASHTREIQSGGKWTSKKLDSFLKTTQTAADAKRTPQPRWYRRQCFSTNLWWFSTSTWGENPLTYSNGKLGWGWVGGRFQLLREEKWTPVDWQEKRLPREVVASYHRAVQNDSTPRQAGLLNRILVKQDGYVKGEATVPKCLQQVTTHRILCWVCGGQVQRWYCQNYSIHTAKEFAAGVSLFFTFLNILHHELPDTHSTSN